MKPALFTVVITGFVASAMAFQPAGSGQPATTPANPAAAAPAAQPEPPMPKPIPVPDGPVVKKTELEGGLIVEDIKIGDGYEVQAGGTVVAHYHGTLKEGGKVFDSSFTRGEPIAFPLTRVIQGWTKGVPGMKVGGVRRLTIPAALGYGPTGAGADIPPNADLIFVIQLVDALRVEDVEVGSGTEVTGQCLPVTSFTMRDKDGKELESKTTADPYIWLPGEMGLPGTEWDTMQLAVVGMKVGGKRKIWIPKEMNYSPPQAQATRPQGVPLEIEVQLLGVRNLQPRR